MSTTTTTEPSTTESTTVAMLPTRPISMEPGASLQYLIKEIPFRKVANYSGGSRVESGSSGGVWRYSESEGNGRVDGTKTARWPAVNGSAVLSVREKCKVGKWASGCERLVEFFSKIPNRGNLSYIENQGLLEIMVTSSQFINAGPFETFTEKTTLPTNFPCGAVIGYNNS